MPSEWNDELQDNVLAMAWGRGEQGVAISHACSAIMALTGLRGFWPMSSVNHIGDAQDFGRSDVMSQVGSPQYNYEGLIPFLGFNGANQWLSHADGAIFDILGTEAYIAPATRGLTLGGWFNFDALDANSEYLMAKHQAGVGGSYNLFRLGGASTIRFGINNGAALLTSTAVVDTSNWWFIVGRFNPGANINIFINDAKRTAVTASAAINNTAYNFTIGADSVGAATTCLDGKSSFCFLCASALSDLILMSIYEQTRPLFQRP